MSSTPNNRRILNFRDLEVWQKSMTVAGLTYEAAKRLPQAEAFELANQLRRACISVPSNIAEGHQLPRGAYRRHVTIALGSLAELDTQLELAIRIGLLEANLVRELRVEVSHVRQMLVRLRASLKPVGESSR